MKIAIVNQTGGGMSGGYRKYLQNILPRMAMHPDVEAMLCATPESIGVQDWFDSMPKVRFVSCKPFRFLFSSRDVELLRELERFSPDVIFVPVERKFRFKSVPVVNMIQNMEPFVANSDGNPLSERFRNWLRSIEGKSALKRSSRVIAISGYVRDFLVQHWNIPNDKIDLVYHGVDLPESKNGHRPDIIPEGWGGRFLFTAGSIRPARGLEDILGAIRHLNKNPRDIPGVLIAGLTTPRMERYRKKLEHWAQENNISSKVCLANSLNKRQMRWCYQNCGIFVMTSRVEACPNIALEAMAHGVICIAANNPPLPEIFDDAAVFYPPKRPEILAQRVQEVLNWSKHKKQEIRQRALKRASQFSWDVCAEKTVEQLQLAIKDFKKRGKER